MEKDLIKNFISSVKNGKRDEAKKQIESMLYAITGNSVRDMKSEYSKTIFKKK